MKTSVDSSNNQNLKTAYINADLQLVEANSAISNVDSALASGKSKDEVQKRISTAQSQLDTARASLSSVYNMTT
jgi:hypothetical protein